MSDTYVRAIHAQYGSKPILDDILKQLQAQGVSLADLRPEHLYHYDQFHMGRDRATRQLAELAGLGEGSLVLDVGAGIGGTTRVFAHEKKIRMVAVDLTETYVYAATALTKLVQLNEHTDFLRAEATHLPFADGVYDGAALQHSSMNIPDKSALLGEISRVLKSGGVLALHDWLRGDGPEPVYPMPWSADGSISYLIRRDEFTSVVAKTGFEIEAFKDLAESYVRRLEQQIKDAQQERSRTQDTEQVRKLVAFEESLMPFYQNLSERRLICYMARLRKTG